VRRHKSPRGPELVFMKVPESEELIELCYFPNSGPAQVQPDLTHLAFEVHSLEEFGKYLASLGLKYSDGPTMKPDGSPRLPGHSDCGTTASTETLCP
jgi:lactoylglutathione lyase